MRVLFLTLGVVTLSFLTSFFYMSISQQYGVEKSTYTGNERFEEKISVIEDEMEKVKSNLERLNATARPSTGSLSTIDQVALHEYEDVMARLASLEEKFDLLSSNAANASNAYQQSDSRIMSVLQRKAYHQNDILKPNLEGEEIFESQEDSPDRDYYSAIANAFDGVDSKITVKDIYCKESMCKVTYSTSPAADGESVNSINDTLVEALSTELGSADLDIYFGRDEYGNSVIYVAP